MDSPLLFDLGGPSSAGWRPALAAAGLDVEGALDRHKLVQCTTGEAPEQVVCLAAGLTTELAAALAGWDGDPPCPVLLLSAAAPADAAEASRAVALGIHHWQPVPAEAGADGIAGLLAMGRALAQARWEHERALRRALARAQEQLDERKWVERAKGVLMSARGLAEDEAFSLLRGAAMNANLRLGELARAVYETAGWAHAINRAGQLRMLSQRFVRLAAQRLLKVGAREALSLQQVSALRVQDNLALLAGQCADTPAAAACLEANRCWERLADELSQRLDAAALERIDTRAGALLAAAEHLTQALQAAAGHRALHIVNICGRQRMRVQRIAKEHLLATLAAAAAPNAPRPVPDDSLIDEFVTALRELEQAPLTSPAIRAILEHVREEWLRLLAGLRTPDPHASARAMVHASETLLQRLDELTDAYEHSLQVIMG
jgi:hypothetical protein